MSLQSIEERIDEMWEHCILSKVPKIEEEE
jgi:hypothetical protein